MGEAVTLGFRHAKSHRIVKAIERLRCETTVPHEVRIERSVNDCRCAPKVEWPTAIGAYDSIVVYANGYGFCIVEAGVWCVAPGTTIVSGDRQNRIEEEETTGVCKV